eukprot:m.92905 g.92905  ORF g.92905 m.92905 type:complete len:145 (-) comp16526_c0_seq3:1122-1556(-)
MHQNGTVTFIMVQCGTDTPTGGTSAYSCGAWVSPWRCWWTTSGARPRTGVSATPSSCTAVRVPLRADGAGSSESVQLFEDGHLMADALIVESTTQRMYGSSRRRRSSKTSHRMIEQYNTTVRDEVYSVSHKHNLRINVQQQLSA